MSEEPIPDEVIEQAARAMERANRSSDPCDDWYVLLAEAAAPVLVAFGREQEKQKARDAVARWLAEHPPLLQHDGGFRTRDSYRSGLIRAFNLIGPPNSGLVEPVGNPEQLPDRSGPLPDFIGDKNVDIHTCHADCPCQMVTVTLSWYEAQALRLCLIVGVPLEEDGVTRKPHDALDSVRTKLRAALEGDQ